MCARKFQACPSSNFVVASGCSWVGLEMEGLAEKQIEKSDINSNGLVAWLSEQEENLTLILHLKGYSKQRMIHHSSSIMVKPLAIAVTLRGIQDREKQEIFCAFLY